MRHDHSVRRVRVLVATRPIDFRKGMDVLCALVQETLRSDPYSGVIYVFRSKRADCVKPLLWDGGSVHPCGLFHGTGDGVHFSATVSSIMR